MEAVVVSYLYLLGSQLFEAVVQFLFEAPHIHCSPASQFICKSQRREQGRGVTCIPMEINGIAFFPPHPDTCHPIRKGRGYSYLRKRGSAVGEYGLEDRSTSAPSWRADW